MKKNYTNPEITFTSYEAKTEIMAGFTASGVQPTINANPYTTINFN